MKLTSLTSIYPILIALILLLVICGCSKEEEVGWPRWRGPNGDGISTETDWNPEALAGGPKILWKANVGLGYSNVVIRDNRLYTMGSTKEGFTVYCLNADTGKETWRKFFNESLDPQSTPAVDGNAVYVLSKKGILLCLNAKNGKLRWKKDLVSEYDVVKPFYGFAGSPVIEGELLILTANTSGIVLNKKTGNKVWDSDKPPEKIRAYWPRQTTGTDYSTPVRYDYEGKRYAILSSYEGMHSVEVETGNVLWLFEWELYSGNYIPDPLIFNNKVFIPEFIDVAAGMMDFTEVTGCVLLDIGGAEPKVLWKNLNMFSEISNPVMIDGYIYGCHGGPQKGIGILRCLEIETGEVMWEENLGKQPALSLMASDGKLIILEENGTLRIAEVTPSSYTEISSCEIPAEKGINKWWTHPVLYKGKIYCRNYVLVLVCIDVSKDS